MKVKIGDLTVRQMKAICDIHSSCDACCPLFGFCDNQPWMQNPNKEIDLPDEEVGKEYKQNTRCCNFINEDGSYGSCEYNDGGLFCQAPNCKRPVITSTLCGARPSGCPFYDEWNRKTGDEEEKDDEV